MKDIIKQTRLVLPGLLSLFLVSCETKFMEYRGQNIIGGTGGTVKVVDGIDFWETGEPDRKCRIVGEIQYDEESDSTIAKVTRKYGGNAVVHAGLDRHGNVDHRMRTKLLVVKYVE
jgi:hypothetical protein